MEHFSGWNWYYLSKRCCLWIWQQSDSLRTVDRKHHHDDNNHFNHHDDSFTLDVYGELQRWWGNWNAQRRHGDVGFIGAVAEFWIADISGLCSNRLVYGVDRWHLGGFGWRFVHPDFFNHPLRSMGGWRCGNDFIFSEWGNRDNRLDLIAGGLVTDASNGVGPP